MTYKINIHKKAQKVLDRAPAHVRERLDKELQKVAVSPRANTPLQGHGGDTYRIRIGDWRVIYEVDDGTVTVTVIKVGPRGDVYK